MNTKSTGCKRLKAGLLKVEIYPSKKDAGKAAAEASAHVMREAIDLRGELAVIFATGASQLETLAALTSIPNLPWSRIHGFHLDEYLGLDDQHPASFRRYLRENLTERVSMKDFSEIDGNTSNPDLLCKEYGRELRVADPQLCLLGIGENGHLAFNDPAEANFQDHLDVKVVTLDTTCRQQQAAEGWFKSLQDVPRRAITVTIPALFRVPRLIISVSGTRKARILRRTLEDPISTDALLPYFAIILMQPYIWTASLRRSWVDLYIELIFAQPLKSLLHRS